MRPPQRLIWIFQGCICINSQEIEKKPGQSELVATGALPFGLKGYMQRLSITMITTEAISCLCTILPILAKFSKNFALSLLGYQLPRRQQLLALAEKRFPAINGKAGISPEMAVRLSIAFNTSSESWLNQQTQFDLWQAEQHRKELHVKRLSAA